MSSEHREADPLVLLWQTQATRSLEVDMEKLRNDADRFVGKIRWRNRTEYFAAVLAIVGFVVAFGVELVAGIHPTVAIGYVSILASVGYVCYVLKRHGSTRNLDPHLGQPGHRFLLAYRNALEQQSRLLHDAWRWYVLPLLGSVLLLHLAKHIERGGTIGEWLFELGYPHGVVAFGVVLAVMNRWAAHHLRRDQAKLDAKLFDTKLFDI